MTDYETDVVRDDVVRPLGDDRGPRRPVRPRVTELMLRWGERFSLIIVLLAFVVYFSVTLPNTFLSYGNVSTMLNAQAILLLLALAITAPLRAGDFDLSVAAVMTFSGTAFGVLTVQHDVPTLGAVAAVLVMGTGIGMLNALLVVRFELNSFISTLGMSIVINGLAIAVASSRIVTGLPASIQTFSQTKLLDVPLTVYYALAVAFVLWWVYEYTPLGRYLLFIGGNRDLAALAGLPVPRYRVVAFVIAGGVSAFAGLALVGMLGSADPTIGGQYLLPPFAAVFLGTTAIQVGRVNVWGTVVALSVLTVGITGLQLNGVASWVSDVFYGGALILAMLFGNLLRRHSRSRQP